MHQTIGADRAPLTTRKRGWSLQRREAVGGVLFALPAILGFLLWNVGPMAASAIISMTDWSLLQPPQHFLGLDNYVGAITPIHPLPAMKDDPLFWRSLGVTLYYTVTAVPLGLLAGFLLALLLSQPIRFAGIFRAIYYLPAILPAVATALTWLWLYNPDFGLLNFLLDWAHLPTSKWVFDETSAVPSLVLLSVWGSGGTMILFLAALKGVPRSYHEAASIDGAGTWGRLWHITLPVISPIILFNLITSLIGTFSGGLVQGLIITNGGPDNATLFYALYIYRTAFVDGHMGYACALSWIMFLFLLVLTLTTLRVARSRVYYEEGDV